MNREWLGVSQMLFEHPVWKEDVKYKKKYINVLNYFVNKYSEDDIFARAMLKNYIEYFETDTKEKYKFVDGELIKISKGVLLLKMRKMKFFTYRYTLLYDCIFINSFLNKEKGKLILEEIKQIYSKRYHKKLNILFEALYGKNDEIPSYSMTEKLAERWVDNRNFMNLPLKSVLITANMSSGKSTLLNALIGLKVNKTQNDACTAKLHYILNKAYEDGLSYEWDYMLDMNADYQTLMEDNESNNSGEITVGTYFNGYIKQKHRICFIDTPGVNSSLDTAHKIVTENAIKNTSYDIILYLLNGENIGSIDDRKYLEFIRKEAKSPIIFVLNKLDRYRKNEDSIKETIEKVEKELIEIGYEKPCIYPVSAYAGFLAKSKLLGQQLNEDEDDELELFVRKFEKDEYALSKYYKNLEEDDNIIENKNNKYMKVLIESGLFCLENQLFNN